MRRIGVVTGTRADYGLLLPVLRLLAADPGFDLRLFVTGMHLSPEFGSTVEVIERDGFVVAERVEMLLSGDTPVAVAKSVGLGVSGFADALARQLPDLLLVLGDRFETLAAVQAAMIAAIPVAHLAGGDLTEGVMDDAIRHCITKMASLHLVTNPVAAARVRQLGEDPARIACVGSPGLDLIRTLRLRSKRQLAAELGIRWRRRNLLLTFHPVATDVMRPAAQLREVFAAIDELGDGVGVVITRPNADPAGRELLPVIDRFVAARPDRAWVFTSLGQERYLSVMAVVDAVVGNSSSGLYEAPSLRRPTVNIGDRQRGRLRAASVLDCPVARAAIAAAIERAFELDCSRVVNPYGDGRAAPRIVAQLRAMPLGPGACRKRFVDLLPANGSPAEPGDVGEAVTGAARRGAVAPASGRVPTRRSHRGGSR